MTDLFTDTFMPRGLRDSWFASDPCPSCGTRLRPVTSFDETHYLCEDCGRCWKPRRGLLGAVDPITCHGCTATSKEACLRLFQETFPRFGMPVAES